MRLTDLTLCQSCQSFYISCSDRAAWSYLYSHYKATLYPRLHWADRPLEYYDTNELRELVLRPFRAERAWKTDGLSPTLHHTISFEKGFNSTVELIRGGRWLLWGTDKGEVHYRDLDLPSSSRSRVLIRWPPNDGARVHKMAVYMDNTASYLKFNLAVILHGSGRRIGRTRSPPANTIGAKIFIWTINSIPDDQGHVVDLEADLLICSSDRLDGELECLSFCRNMLAYSIKGRRFTRIWEWDAVKWSRLKGRLMLRSFKVRSLVNSSIIRILTEQIERCITSQWMDCLFECTQLSPSLQSQQDSRLSHRIRYRGSLGNGTRRLR